MANHSDYKDQWQVTVAATFWTIWLHRNDHTFQQKDNPINQVKYLIAHRPFIWCQSRGLLHSNSRKEWFLRPIRAIKMMFQHFLIELKEQWDYYYFSDGSWKNSNGSITSGIGGYININLEDLMYIYSGPVTASSPLEAETKALFTLMQAIHNNIDHDKKIIIHTDSYNLWYNFHKFGAGLRDKIDYLEAYTMDIYYYIHISHIPRSYNRGADILAKTGSSRPNTILGCA